VQPLRDTCTVVDTTVIRAIRWNELSFYPFFSAPNPFTEDDDNGDDLVRLIPIAM